MGFEPRLSGRRGRRQHSTALPFLDLIDGKIKQPTLFGQPQDAASDTILARPPEMQRVLLNLACNLLNYDARIDASGNVFSDGLRDIVLPL